MKTKLNDIRAVFFPLNTAEKYKYLGITYNIFKKDSEPYYILNNFIKNVDKMVKPWWCPRWFLRYLHLFGDDNSIVRVRNRKLHDLRNKITNGVLITDLKGKWGTMRIYGWFTDDIQKYADETENKLDKYIEIY